MSGNQTASPLAVMRDALRAKLPSEGWAVGHYVDDRPCLLLEDTVWVGGFFERGNFDVRFRTSSFDEAVVLFTRWVVSIEESTRLSAEVTARWLAQHGKTKP